MKRRLAAIFFLTWGLTACAGTPPPHELRLTPARFADLPGWGEDHPRAALMALARSCPSLVKKSASAGFNVDGGTFDWRPACAALLQIHTDKDAEARAFLETYFVPYAASGEDGDEGLFTGYYEAELHGSLKRTKHFHVPLYAKPKDLVTVDLGLFQPEWKGKKIAGKVKAAKLIPYDDRAAIARNSLARRAKVLVWVDDPIAAFFLEIQGSGRVKLTNGRTLRIGYDGANGRGYTAIGRSLADANELPRPVTMQAIRAWLAAHPERMQEVMNLNASYIFFRRLNNDESGPVGAQGVALIPERSLAVDPAFIPLGTPLWLDTVDADGMPLRRLMIAQDTGGAIKGPVRGDVFWGTGPEAEKMAGAMQSRGRYYLLLPQAVMPNAEK